jgi:EAL domain-containing protein (putative c-di-GMP-specific phosphodiesterase class I)
VLKLDKGLVQELPDDGARTVLRAITELAHRLGAVVVAEGVETEQVADEVTALGVDLGQGWLFGRPVRPEQPVEETESRWQPARPLVVDAGSVESPAGEHRPGVLVAEDAVAAGR